MSERGSTVRRATLDDVAELVAMRWEMSVEQRGASEDREIFERRCGGLVHDALIGKDWTVWVAEAGGRLAANVWTYSVPRVPRPWPRNEPWGYVTNVFAREAYRDSGVGSRLLDTVIQWAKQAKLHLLLAWPSERSVSFYTRAGFVRSPDALELTLIPEE